MPHVQEPALEVPDIGQCEPQPIRIIHVGMGAAGMLCAFKARKMLTNYELICYEKNESPGGTW
jgi:cation diffusion facilitator CzcD-associated flavoprotein CzcO